MQKGLDELEGKIDKLEIDLGEMDTKQDLAVKEIHHQTNTIQDNLVTKVEKQITVVDSDVKERLKELEGKLSTLDENQKEGNTQLSLTLNQTFEKIESERQLASDKMDKDLELSLIHI